MDWRTQDKKIYQVHDYFSKRRLQKQNTKKWITFKVKFATIREVFVENKGYVDVKSKIATEVSIKIMDAFVAMRHYIGNNLIEQKYINNLVLEHEE